jgi:hypothetical protein
MSDEKAEADEEEVTTTRRTTTPRSDVLGSARFSVSHETLTIHLDCATIHP